MSKLDELIRDQVESMIDRDFVTAKFGPAWKEGAKEFDKDMIIDMAWRQGRRALLLERLLRKYENVINSVEGEKDSYNKDVKQTFNME